jgi:hypothetical protein
LLMWFTSIMRRVMLSGAMITIWCTSQNALRNTIIIWKLVGFSTHPFLLLKSIGRCHLDQTYYVLFLQPI